MAPSKIPFDEAIGKAGFGLYSFLMTALTGVCVLSFTCIAFGNMFLIPTGACELKTTTKQQGLLAAAPVIGLILGGFLWGYLADTRGRRSLLLICLLGGLTFNIIAVFSINWIMMLILQFFASIFASGDYTIAMSLLSESVPVSKKNHVVLLVASIFVLSPGIMALLALPVIPLKFSYHLSGLDIYWNSWRLLMLVYCIPSIASAVFLFFLQESPKFVHVKGDEQHALQILRVIHKINNLKSENQLQVNGLMMEDTVDTAAKKSVKEQIGPLFKPPYLKFTIIVTMLYVSQQIGAFMVWLPKLSNQFVHIIQKDETSDAFTICGILNMAPPPVRRTVDPCSLNEMSIFMVFGVGSVQSVCNLGMTLMISYLGRRNTVRILAPIFGISGVLVNLVPSIIFSIVLFVIMLQGILMIGLYTAIVVAIFPTHLRTMALAFALSVSRLCLFGSIQILNLLLAHHCNVGFYIYGALLASSAILATFLPDDRGQSLANQKPITDPKKNILSIK